MISKIQLGFLKLLIRLLFIKFYLTLREDKKVVETIRIPYIIVPKLFYTYKSLLLIKHRESSKFYVKEYIINTVIVVEIVHL